MIAFIILLSLGIGCFVGSVFLLCHAKKWDKNGKIVYGVIAAIYCSDDNTTVIVDYEVDGEVYRQELGTYVIGMRKGKRVPIHYMPDEPSKITYNKGNRIIFAVILVMAIGLIIGAITFIL